MTHDEFERLRRRFGDDVAAWPAPYRQQARTMSAAEDGIRSIEDDALDCLVLDAAMMDTDDDRLARQVLARVNVDRGPAFGTLLPGLLLRPSVMAACAALLFVALAAGGYQMAESQAEPTDARLLALAAGLPVGVDLLDLAADPSTEDAL